MPLTSTQHELMFRRRYSIHLLAVLTQKLVDGVLIFLREFLQQGMVGMIWFRIKPFFVADAYGTAMLYQHSLDGVTSFRQQEVSDIPLQLLLPMHLPSWHSVCLCSMCLCVGQYYVSATTDQKLMQLVRQLGICVMVPQNQLHFINVCPGNYS